MSFVGQTTTPDSCQSAANPTTQQLTAQALVCTHMCAPFLLDAWSTHTHAMPLCTQLYNNTHFATSVALGRPPAGSSVKHGPHLSHALLLVEQGGWSGGGHRLPAGPS